MAKAKDNRVEVFIPRAPGNNEANLFVGVNGVSFLLPRGKKSMVPDYVAAEIKRAEAAQEAMYEEQQKLLEQAAK